MHVLKFQKNQRFLGLNTAISITLSYMNLSGFQKQNDQFPLSSYSIKW